MYDISAFLSDPRYNEFFQFFWKWLVVPVEGDQDLVPLQTQERQVQNDGVKSTAGDVPRPREIRSDSCAHSRAEIVGDISHLLRPKPVGNG